tara:strand:+ start:1438 stop:1857 length:420 start_codon:yes stop_codon:yes gene_type:complete
MIKKLLILMVILLIGCSVSDDVTIEKIIPIEDIKVGDEVEFTVKVINSGSGSHEIRSIDIDEEFLVGILISETVPKTVEEYNVFGQHIFEFKTDVAGESSKDIVFKGKAVKQGDFSGDMDVCIDGDASCLFNSIRIFVS